MKIPTLILALFSLLFQGGGQPISIPIQNPSFEPTSALSGYPSDRCGIRGTVPEWQMNPNAGSGVLQLANPNPCGIPAPPSGTTVAMAGYGGTFSQTLSTTPAQLQEYRP